MTDITFEDKSQDAAYDADKWNAADANEVKTAVNSKQDIGSALYTALDAEPASPTAGLVVLADRSNWDPLGVGSGGAYLTMYLGATSGWGTLTGQLDE